MRAVWEPVMSGVLHHTLQQSACEFFARRTFLVFKNHNTALAVQVAAFFIVVFFFNDDSELEKKNHDSITAQYRVFSLT